MMAKKVLISKARDVLEDKLPAGLEWPDVEGALRMIDSVEELTRAAQNPEAFLRELAEEAGEAGKRLVLAKALDDAEIFAKLLPSWLLPSPSDTLASPRPLVASNPCVAPHVAPRHRRRDLHLCACGRAQASHS